MQQKPSMTTAGGEVPLQQVERGTCLLGEGLVGGGGLNAEVLHAIDVVLVLRDCLRRCLSDSQQVQVAAVPLVEEQLVACRAKGGAAAWTPLHQRRCARARKDGSS